MGDAMAAMRTSVFRGKVFAFLGACGYHAASSGDRAE